MLDGNHIARIARIKDGVINYFDAGDWFTLAAYLGDEGRVIINHSRLLRSLNFGDPDYPACVADVLGDLVQRDTKILDLIESMLDQKTTEFSSAGFEESELQFGASIARSIPDPTLATAMMPFAPSFNDIKETMRRACESNGLNLKTADDIWQHSVLIQDIFSLIKNSCIVLADFSGKNPNVMYETGVAHALGKEVIPISQSLEDVPFDLQHHRVLVYENNQDGRCKLQQRLEDRIKTIINKHEW